MLLINNPGDRDALTYDGNPKKSARLHIEFFDNPTCDDDDEDNDGNHDNHDDEDNDSNHDDRKEALALKDKLEDYNEKDDFSCPPTQLVESLTLTDLVATTKGTAHTETIPETLFLDDEVATTKGTAHTETIPETLFLDDEVATTKGTAHTETIPETLFLDDEVA